MPRELVIIRHCDLCAAGQDAPVVSSYAVAIGPEDTRPALATIDVCEGHDSMVKELAAVLVPVPAPAAAAVAAHTRGASGPCRICGDPFKGRTGLVSHLQNRHGAARVSYPKGACPECGKRFGSPSSIGTHRFAAHGYDAVEAAYATAIR